MEFCNYNHDQATKSRSTYLEIILDTTVVMLQLGLDKKFIQTNADLFGPHPELVHLDLIYILDMQNSSDEKSHPKTKFNL